MDPPRSIEDWREALTKGGIGIGLASLFSDVFSTSASVVNAGKLVSAFGSVTAAEEAVTALGATAGVFRSYFASCNFCCSASKR